MEKSFFNPIVGKLENWMNTIIEMLPNFVVAIIVVIAFALSAKYIRKGLMTLMNKAWDNSELSRILSRVVQIAIISVGAMLALSVLHLDKTVTSLLAGAGVVGIALSFAFQDMAANFVSGFFMAAKKPFEIGDVIEVNDIIGTVKKIKLRTTEIETFDGNEVLLPNRYLFENAVKNYYRTKTRMVQLDVGVSYAEDLDRVEEITQKAIESMDKRVADADVQVIYKEFGGSSINLEVRYWVPYDTYYQYLKGISEGIKAIKKAYDKNNISIPFPIRTLDFGIKGGKSLSKSLIDQAQVVESN